MNYFYVLHYYRMPYFQFKIGNEIVYRTQVQSLQCADHTKAGARCKRRCVIGSPYCATHLAYQHHLKIKPSNIPNSGKGLFAWNPMSSNQNEIVFRKNETICAYKGEIINEEELIERYGDKTAPYAVSISRDRYEDAGKIRGIGSLANTNPGHNNATLSIYRGHASLKATKNIHNREEIYLSYGREYRLNEPGVEYATTTK